MFKILKTLILTAFPCLLLAGPDSILIEQKIKTAIGCLERNQPDSARDFHREALSLLEKNDRLARWLSSHIGIGLAWANAADDPFPAIALMERAAAHPPRQPKNPLEWEKYALLLMNTGYVYQKFVGDLSEAKHCYERSYDIFVRHLNEKNDGIAGYLYHQLGNLYTRFGDFERARTLLRKGIEYGKKHHKPGIGKYGDLALVLLELDENQSALEVVREGLAVPEMQTKSKITLHFAEAQALLNLGKPAAAHVALERVPPLIRRLKKEGSQTDDAYYLSSYHQTRGDLFAAQGKIQTAEREFQTALRLETESWGTSKRREVAKVYFAYGEMLLQTGQPEKALHAFQTMLTCVLKNFQPKNDFENPEPTTFIAENVILEALEGKANACIQLNQPEIALQCLELIPVVEAKLRETFAYESSSLLTLREGRRRFDLGVSIAYQLFEKTKNPAFAQRAFRLTEQARGLLLLQSLARARADYQLPEDIRRREHELRSRIAWLEQQIAEARETGSANANALENTLFQLKQDQKRFETELRKTHQTYATLSDSIRLVATAEVPKLLRRDQSLLDFYLTETDAYIFFFDKNGLVSWRKATIPGDFREKIRQFVQYLSRPDEANTGRENFKNIASELHDFLLKPELDRASANLKSLVIVPDDALSFLPFEILLTEKTGPNWAEMPFLIKKMAVSYAYSATLLRMQQEISAGRSGRRASWAGFAPSYSNQQDSVLQKILLERERGGVYDLKGTHIEVQAIHRIFGGEMFDGAPATEAQFKAVAEKFRILHLAMHAIANEENPTLSRLLFGDRKTNETEDNILYANELQVMRLQADLAVLSACHTGFGKWQRGEGVYSLARAFAAAGVPSTVMSLWRLPDGSAPVLMQVFYKKLADGVCKDEALRSAKLAFLETDSLYYFSHPYYWAGVAANGDMRPLKTGVAAWIWALIALFVALSAGFVFFKKSRQAIKK